MGCLFLVL